jgi:hypothetical protein
MGHTGLHIYIYDLFNDAVNGSNYGPTVSNYGRMTSELTGQNLP